MQREALVEAVSGAAGSILALLATFPLKTIYTLQALSADAKGTGTAPVLSVMDIITKYRLQGLYTGIGPSVFESGLSSAVYFYLYSRLRELAVQAKNKSSGPGFTSAAKPAGSSTKNQSIGVVASLLVAAVAGIGNQLVTMPAAVVITRMQAQQKSKVESAGAAASTSVASIVRQIWDESGLPGFWAGLLPALILVVNPAIQYMLYEQMLRFLRTWKSVRQQRRQETEQQQGQHEQGDGSCSQPESSAGSPAPRTARDASGRLSAGEIFVASALAKIGATVATYPMIVVKSRMQAAGKSSPHHHGTLSVISRTLQEEGMGGFFKGLKAKILQTALNAALMLMLKEQCYNLTKAAATTSVLRGGPGGAKAALLKAA